MDKADWKVYWDNGDCFPIEKLPSKKPDLSRLKSSFVSIQKQSPKHLLLTGIWENKHINNAFLYVFDHKTKTYSLIWKMPVFESMVAGGPDCSSDWEDHSQISWGKWLKDGYRELIYKTRKKDRGSSGDCINSLEFFKTREQIYSWNNGQIYLSKDVRDNQIIINRKAGFLFYQIQAMRQKPLQDCGRRLIELFMSDEAQVSDQAKKLFHSKAVTLKQNSKHPPKDAIRLLAEHISNNDSLLRDRATKLLFDLAFVFQEPIVSSTDLVNLIKLAEQHENIKLLQSLSFMGHEEALPLLTDFLAKGISYSRPHLVYDSLVGIYPLVRPELFSKKLLTSLETAAHSTIRFQKYPSTHLAQGILEALAVSEGKKHGLKHLLTICKADNLRIRTHPSLSGKILSHLNKEELAWVSSRGDTTETISESTDYWYEIMTMGGLRGWVFGAYLKNDPFTKHANKLINTRDYFFAYPCQRQGNIELQHGKTKKFIPYTKVPISRSYGDAIYRHGRLYIVHNQFKGAHFLGCELRRYDRNQKQTTLISSNGSNGFRVSRDEKFIAYAAADHEKPSNATLFFLRTDGTIIKSFTAKDLGLWTIQPIGWKDHQFYFCEGGEGGCDYGKALKMDLKTFHISKTQHDYYSNRHYWLME